MKMQKGIPGSQYTNGSGLHNGKKGENNTKIEPEKWYTEPIWPYKHNVANKLGKIVAFWGHNKNEDCDSFILHGSLMLEAPILRPNASSAFLFAGSTSTDRKSTSSRLTSSCLNIFRSCHMLKTTRKWPSSIGVTSSSPPRKTTDCVHPLTVDLV